MPWAPITTGPSRGIFPTLHPGAKGFKRTLDWCGAAACGLAAPLAVPLVLLLATCLRLKRLVR